MDPYDSRLDKAYEQLNEAIMRAIVSSDDVRKVLTKFKSQDLINNLSVLNLVLSLEELSDLVFSQDEDAFHLEPVEEDPSEFSSQPPDSPEIPSFSIDGRSLTPNEIMFERYYQRNFDEKKWLKKVRIKF